MWSTPYGDKRNTETHENQGGVEILIVFLHILGVVLHCLSFVRGVEIKLWVVVLDWLEVHSQGLLDAIGWSQLVGTRNRFYISKTHHRGSTLTGFALSSPLIVVFYRRCE